MAKIVIFDSGFGSLSVIRHLQKLTKSHIIYFADQENFPYGKKTISELKEIINKSLICLQEKFKPDLIVLGSITLSLTIYFKNKSSLIGVFPPVKKAAKKTKTSSIAILATNSIIKSRILFNYISKNLSKQISVIQINASPLIELVESGDFVSNKEKCTEKITKVLYTKLRKNNVDVVLLSSTHLPFLLPLLKKIFQDINFLEPSMEVAETVSKKILKNKSKRNSLKIFASGNVIEFEKKLKSIGIQSKVNSFHI